MLDTSLRGVVRRQTRKGEIGGRPTTRLAHSRADRSPTAEWPAQCEKHRPHLRRSVSGTPPDRLAAPNRRFRSRRWPSTMSIPPNLSMPLSTAFCIADRSRTSATTVSTRSSPMRAATSLSSPSSRSVSTTLAPLSCSCRATSAPIPLAPPVIRATFPFTEPMAVNVLRPTRRRADWASAAHEWRKCGQQGAGVPRRAGVGPAALELGDFDTNDRVFR